MFTEFIASKFTAHNPEYLSDFDQPKGIEREDKFNLYTTKTFIGKKRHSNRKCTFIGEGGGMEVLAVHGGYQKVCTEFLFLHSNFALAGEWFFE